MRTCWKGSVALNSPRALDQLRLTLTVILIFYQGQVVRLGSALHVRSCR
jgi:hypothetical protein